MFPPEKTINVGRIHKKTFGSYAIGNFYDILYFSLFIDLNQHKNLVLKRRK